MHKLLASAVVAAVLTVPAHAQDKVRDLYNRNDYMVPMRDGVRLYTVVYSPKDKAQTYPFLMTRTPYGVGPYDKASFRFSLGPSPLFVKEGYIFVYQDVRGCYMSEGVFDNMRPHNPSKKAKTDIDESSDTYDTIDWLLKHVPNHNGKVGHWGISYPGFYAAAGMCEAHPALKAVSPQAPIADWFFDDFFHHGAFFLPHAFNFFSSFGYARPEPTTSRPGRFKHPTPDGYQFFLDIGSLKNVNPRYFKDQIAFWNTFIEHPTYDAFWQARNILPHLKKTAPAVLTVGGWFDAEDLYGPLQIYRAIEKNNPGIFNALVMGPWSHGQWSAPSATGLGGVTFGSNTSAFYQKNIELPFFNHFLKGKGEHGLPEAYVFETGINTWRKFDQWPPAGVERKKLYPHSKGRITFKPPTETGEAYDEFISDPHRPVPHSQVISTGMNPSYMTEDQRYASRRPDVAVYQTDVLKEPITLAGPLRAELVVSTTGTDSDWIVKLIDVYGGDDSKAPGAGYQMLVRSEVMRGRYRNSYEKPEPFKPGQPTKVVVELQDVMHTFAKGHRIMIHINSTWFPLIDRNPQKYVKNIFLAEDSDFVTATQRVYRSREHATAIEVGVLPRSVQK